MFFVVNVQKGTLKPVMQDGTSKPHERSNSCKQDGQDESFGCMKTPKTDLAYNFVSSFCNNLNQNGFYAIKRVC